MNAASNLVYAGFWRRLLATIIDSILLAVIITPVLMAIYGDYYWYGDYWFFAGTLDFWLGWVLPGVTIILFWIYKSATPGKMLLSVKLCDARTGGKPSPGQCIGRYFAYILSALLLCLGFIWIAFDNRKQGWHDKLAGTVVVHKVSLPATDFEPAPSTSPADSS